jgi:hypothetical protein
VRRLIAAGHRGEGDSHILIVTCRRELPAANDNQTGALSGGGNQKVLLRSSSPYVRTFRYSVDREIPRESAARDLFPRARSMAVTIASHSIRSSGVSWRRGARRRISAGRSSARMSPTRRDNRTRGRCSTRSGRPPQRQTTGRLLRADVLRCSPAGGGGRRARVQPHAARCRWVGRDSSSRSNPALWIRVD